MNHINTNLDLVDLNHANLNQLFPAYLTTINDSADVCALNKILEWDRDSTDAASSMVYTRTPLAYVPSIYTSYTPPPVHSLHPYSLVPASKTFNYGTSDAPSPSHDSSSESMTLKGNPTTCNKPNNLVPNVPADPYLNPISSYSPSSYSSDLSYNEYSKQRQCTETITE